MKFWEARKESYVKCLDVSVNGYIDKEEQVWQTLCMEYRLLGVLVWRTIVFREQIPSGCYYQYVCTGYTSWKSKRPDLVDEWSRARNERERRTTHPTT
jgi:hypothetical protein